MRCGISNDIRFAALLNVGVGVVFVMTVSTVVLCSWSGSDARPREEVEEMDAREAAKDDADERADDAGVCPLVETIPFTIVLCSFGSGVAEGVSPRCRWGRESGAS